MPLSLPHGWGYSRIDSIVMSYQACRCHTRIDVAAAVAAAAAAAAEGVAVVGGRR